jgi:hypothetical protein
MSETSDGFLSMSTATTRADGYLSLRARASAHKPWPLLPPPLKETARAMPPATATTAPAAASLTFAERWLALAALGWSSMLGRDTCPLTLQAHRHAAVMSNDPGARNIRYWNADATAHPPK